MTDCREQVIAEIAAMSGAISEIEDDEITVNDLMEGTDLGYQACATRLAELVEEGRLTMRWAIARNRHRVKAYRLVDPTDHIPGMDDTGEQG